MAVAVFVWTVHCFSDLRSVRVVGLWNRLRTGTVDIRFHIFKPSFMASEVFFAARSEILFRFYVYQKKIALLGEDHEVCCVEIFSFDSLQVHMLDQ